MSSSTIPGFRCGVCLDGITDDDCTHNYSDQDHDGYWCGECLRAYYMPRTEALEHLRQRLHPQSWLTVDAA